MEQEKLVFKLVEGWPTPTLILSKEDEAWKPLYVNAAMKRLGGFEPGEANPELERLLVHCDDFLASGSGSLEETVFFGGTYDVRFFAQEQYLSLQLIPAAEGAGVLDELSFHELSGACNALIVILDEQGRLVDMNGCFLDFVGMERAAVTGKGFFETFIPGDLAQLQHYFEQVLSQDRYHQHFVTPMKTAAGETYKINWQVSRIEKHEQRFIIAVGSDISTLVEENSKLKQEIKSIAVGFDYFPLAVAFMNAEGVFTKMSERFMKLFGMNAKHENVRFDQIPLFKKHIGFEKLNEHIELIKEMHYKIVHRAKGKAVPLQVDIRMLQGKNAASRLYIVVVQKAK